VAIDVDWGFDDVLIPAAGADELHTRLRLAISRRRNALEGALKFGDLVLHPARFTATLLDKDLGLALTEFKLLNFLVQHAGRAFTSTRLMHEMWGYDCNGGCVPSTFTCDGCAPSSDSNTNTNTKVDTVRGVGYMAGPNPIVLVRVAARASIIHTSGLSCGVSNSQARS
jgi:DNA-binding response OmpR family regulator